jgi:CheY-like chemotaxis protein
MASLLWIDDKAGDGTEKRLGFDALIYFIEKKGHNVDIVSTDEQIENALRSDKKYDLVILDIIMDALSSSTDHTDQFGGFDALEILMNARPTTPIIILSVMSTPMIKDEAARRHIDLTKSMVKQILRKGPIRPTDLAEIVETILADTKNIPTGAQI